MNFATFFHAATGHTPYGYQRRLACGEPSRNAPSGPIPCASQLIDIPTGLGRLAAQA